MKRVISAAVLLALTFALVAGCGGVSDAPKENLAELNDGYYVFGKHENDFLNFYIRIYKDEGTYLYYETPISSFFGTGEYTVENGVLTIIDRRSAIDGAHECVNRFKIEENKLVFIANGSDNFMYVKLEDGATFDFRDE